jgi:isopentenyldiphosphate isomerase
MMSHAELIDRVDANDQVIEIIPRPSGVLNVHYFRAINGFIRNSAGALWIPRRTVFKEAFPLHLDSSVAGVVQSGETYFQAFQREVAEELNLDVGFISYTKCAYLSPIQDPVSCFMEVYEIRTDAVPSYNTDDFCEFYWLTPQELYSLLQRGEKAKSDLAALIRLLYL